jgi:hypothetical protein
LLAVLASMMVGCQVAPPVSVKMLAQHREISDLSGLKPADLWKELNVTWAVPGRWEALNQKKTALYTHQQWRSPSMATGVGVVHVKMPLALPASMVVWAAKQEYLRRASEDDGRIIGQWNDKLGRQWFEAENGKYHIRGYAMTRGSEAWIVYSGYRLAMKQRPHEIALAERSLESVVPAK